MLDMLFTDVTELAVENPQAATAVATGDLVTVTFALTLVTFALVVVGCLIGILQIRVVSRGIDKMTEASEKRDQRHEDAMNAETKRHTEAMEAETKRHQESMTALHALIRNTSAGTA